MDDIVRQALAKWPNVPHCYGWLALDARGGWYMRDDRVQALGAFDSGVPGAKGSLLKHEKLVDFIHRNYDSDATGQWFFQNGPQRVYVELEVAPLIWRINRAADASPSPGLAVEAGRGATGFTVAAHTGEAAVPQRCVTDEHGRVYLDTDLGFGLVHTQDVGLAAEAVEQGLWVPVEVPARELPTRFGYVRSPAATHAMLHK